MDCANQAPGQRVFGSSGLPMSLLPDTAQSADPVDTGYSSWRLDGFPLEIRIHPEVIDAIAKDILECPDGEVDGALRGRREAGDSEILWIEGHKRLEAAAEAPEDAIGFYRGTASKDGFPDADGPPDSLLMAVHPDASGGLAAHFFVPGASGNPEPAEPAFPFVHRTQNKARRLVPDFDHAAEPGRSPAAASIRDFILQPRAVPLKTEQNEDEEEPETGRWAGLASLLRRFWPLLAALALTGAAVWLLPRLLSRQAVAPAEASGTAAVRPLGLFVDPASPNWRISWNRDASVLQRAAMVRLFIHDGEEQNGVDLTSGDLSSGMYEYKPHGNDVTFRLEATGAPETAGAPGRVSAESFRLVRTAAEPAATPSAGKAAASASATTPPLAVHRVAPVVAASLRPRIRGKILVDIRVQIDTRGRVTSAVPGSRPRKGIETELTGSAVRASRAWRFDPATSGGKAVAGTQTLHFVFEK